MLYYSSAHCAAVLMPLYLLIFSVLFSLMEVIEAAEDQHPDDAAIEADPGVAELVRQLKMGMYTSILKCSMFIIAEIDNMKSGKIYKYWFGVFTDWLAERRK